MRGAGVQKVGGRARFMLPQLVHERSPSRESSTHKCSDRSEVRAVAEGMGEKSSWLPGNAACNIVIKDFVNKTMKCSVA